jgi:DNA-binding beta-propeller fold protein YncE
MKRIRHFQTGLAVLAAGNVLCFAQFPSAENFATTAATVGPKTGGDLTPVNQRITPVGTVLELPGLRPQALALSPDGNLLVTAGFTHELVVANPANGQILQRVEFPPENSLPAAVPFVGNLNPAKRTMLSYTGLVFSPDGSRIYMANVNGDIKVFAVDDSGRVIPWSSFPLPPVAAPGREEDIPAGLAVSRDGKKLYVVLSFSNRLAELDTDTGKILRLWDVGADPYGVVLLGDKVYVSNWAGRRPDAGSVTGPGGRGTVVRVDDRSIPSEGSVSIINLNSPEQTELPTGRHCCDLAASPDGAYLVAANPGDDTLSVIDTRRDQIVETICARQNPGDLFGAQPNAVAFDKGGDRLFVCNGTQNAVAVFQFKPGASTLLGLIPTGWFPGAIVYDAARKQICVANLKGLSRPHADRRGQTAEFAGSLTFIPLPAKKQLARDTQTALEDLRYPLLAQAKLPARADQAARPVPERTGEPSVFEHVIYIIKENRTYDQILGDVKTGNGRADICTFGERVTPNEHKLVRDFVLLDNTYCCGNISADGHSWADSGIATDYLERSFAGWPRSYPSGGFGKNADDAMAYSPSGFLWNDALAHGKTFRDFGEFTSPSYRWKDPADRRPLDFLACYHEFLAGRDSVAYSGVPDIEALRPFLATNTIGWGLGVPDVCRAAQFIKSLKQFEAAGQMPNLIVLWLPNDHTSGTSPGAPTPEAQVADNDLALGRIVEAVSHSVFWTNTCIFAMEDDPQAGWDHVSGYRSTAYVISPYTKRGREIGTQYNQTSLLRTMELMLGLPPMNQMDATATPMFDCFNGTPDFTPYTAVPNQVPLDEMNPQAARIADPVLRKDAYVSARLPLKKPDQCPEDVLNRILWHATMGAKPYPEWAVTKVADDD